jgi:Tfp pilus assembly protein PilF
LFANIVANREGKSMERIQKLKAFLAENGDDSFVQHALALEYVKLNDDGAAREMWDALLKRDEDYVGSYYHLAKLLERQGERDAAAATYEKGMEIARKVGDRHAYGELQGALEDM